MDPTVSPSAVVGEAPGPNNQDLESLTVGKTGAKKRLSQTTPSTGNSGARLNSLRVCTTGPSHAPYHTHEVRSVGSDSGPRGNREEKKGPPIIFQGGRQRHNRPTIGNIDGIEESTCPPIDRAVGAVYYISRKANCVQNELNKAPICRLLLGLGWVALLRLL